MAGILHGFYLRQGVLFLMYKLWGIALLYLALTISLLVAIGSRLYLHDPSGTWFHCAHCLIQISAKSNKNHCAFHNRRNTDMMGFYAAKPVRPTDYFVPVVVSGREIILKNGQCR